MGLNQKAKQKKALKKTLKRKKQLATRKPQQQLSKAALKIQEVKQAANAPIHKILISNDLLEEGFGSAIFSRKLLSGNIALSVFIMDLDNLGVKECFYNQLAEKDFDNALESQEEKVGKLREVAPELMKKLILGAVEHAKSKGKDPHEQYPIAKHLFADIDASTCSETFEFGHYEANREKRKLEASKAARASAIEPLRSHYKTIFA